MANNQTLPNMNLDSKVSMIQSPGATQVVAPKWEEQKYKMLSQFTNGVIGVSDAYRNLKHTEMMAKMDNVAQQELFKLQNANDPCEIPNIVNESHKMFDEMYKDDPYGKSFYKSDLYNKFRIKYDSNVMAENLKLQKKFDVIQATRTGNELSSDIALMGDPTRMSNALNTYVSQIKTLNLDPLEEEKLITQVVKDSFGKVFSNDPNNAVNWYNASQGMFDKYGIDGADIKDKADKYNKALASEKLTMETKLAAKKKRDEEASAERLIAEHRLGKKTSSQIQLEADTISPYVGNKIYEELNKGGGELLSKELNAEFQTRVGDSDYEDTLKEALKFEEEHPEIPGKTRAYINDIIEKKKTEEGFEDSRIKNRSSKNLNEATVIINNVENAEDLKDAVKLYNKLNIEDQARFIERLYSKIEKLKTENKNDANEQRKLQQSENYFKMRGGGKTYSEEEIGKLVKDEYITEEQGKDILSNQSKEEGEAKKESKEEFKETSKQNLTNYIIEAQANSNKPEKLAKMITSDYPDLIADDRKALIEKVFAIADKYDAEQKALFEDERKKEQSKATQTILNDIDKGNIPSDKQMEDFALFLTEEQLSKIRTAKSNKLGAIKKENITKNNSDIIYKANTAWSLGKTIDVNSYLNQMVVDEKDEEYWRDKLREGNKKVLTEGYNAAYSDVNSQIWKNGGRVTDDTLDDLATSLSKYGIKEKAEIFEELVKDREEAINDRNNIKASHHSNLETYWVPVTNVENPLEKTKKTEAKKYINALVDAGKTVDIQDIISKYRPTAEMVYNHDLEKGTAETTLSAQREIVFEYDEDKKSSVSKGFEYDYDFGTVGGVFDYYNRVNYLKSKNHISSEKQSEFLSPVFQAQAKIVDEGLKDANRVLGHILQKVSTTLNPKGGISSYTRVFDITSDILNALRYKGITYNMSLTDRAFRIDGDVATEQQLSDMENTIDSIIKIKTGGLNADSDVIVLSDGTEIKNKGEK